jgi:hypothetical protein
MRKALGQTQRIRGIAIVVPASFIILAIGCASEHEDQLEDETWAAEVRSDSEDYAHCDQILAGGVFNQYDSTFNYDEHKVIVASACNVLHEWNNTDQAAFSKECGSDSDTTSVDIGVNIVYEMVPIGGDLGWGTTEENSWCNTAQSRESKRKGFYSMHCSDGSESHGLSEALTEVTRTADEKIVKAWSECVTAVNKNQKRTALECFGRMNGDQEGLTFKLIYTRGDPLAPTVLDLGWTRVNASLAEGETLNPKMGEGNIAEYLNIKNLGKTTKIKVEGSGVGDTGKVTCEYELGPIEGKICDGPDIRGAHTNRLYQKDSPLCIEPPVLPPPEGNPLRWGMKVVLTGTDTGHFTNHCGWFGCRVAFMDEDRRLRFDHGGLTPQSFWLRPALGPLPDPECIHWHDRIVIAHDEANGDTFNCGWYGCRVAQLNQNPEGDQHPGVGLLEFDHGGPNPTAFYARPPVGETKSGCIQTGDEVVLAYTDADGETFNCGWYGCRVGHFDGNDLIIDHGEDDPAGLYVWDAALSSP